MRALLAALLLSVLLPPVSFAQERHIVLQSTTSTQNSGLLDAILPRFEAETGIDVRVVAVGTGQALQNARNGDGDLLLVHAEALEKRFVAEGWGLARFPVMYNDFVLVGPASDPAGIAGIADTAGALDRIARQRARFVSRGDSSGTHLKEMSLWALANSDPVPHSGTWYLETGAGMGTTLNVAIETGAYALTDRGTWISFGRRGDHKVLLQGDPQLFNQYGLVTINPARHPHIRAEAAQVLVDWMLGPDGQQAIAGFRLSGEQLFFPNAGK